MSKQKRRVSIENVEFNSRVNMTFMGQTLQKEEYKQQNKDKK